MSEEAPERIWLQVGDDSPHMECTYAEAVKAGAEISWCQDKIFQSDIEYVRSDRRLSPETVERLRSALLETILKECGYE